ncbi:hypothetical protein Hanom_Chr14g01300791 [Helianthus anomalus]
MYLERNLFVLQFESLNHAHYDPHLVACCCYAYHLHFHSLHCSSSYHSHLHHPLMGLKLYPLSGLDSISSRYPP